MLLARDELACALTTEQPVPVAAMARIAELDQRLKDAACKIDAIAGRETLFSWRQSIHPVESPWWWSLDETATLVEQPSPLWAIPAALLFTISLTVIADTMTTLKNGGINALSTFGTLIQTLLTLLAGSAFLSGGREWLEKLFAHVGIHRKFQGSSRVWLAAGVLVVTLVIRIYLPAGVVARYRNYQGDRSLANKQYFSAVEEYQQAVALKPDYTGARYSLAVAYDKSRDYANAIRQYELSIIAAPKNYDAYNKLARLYILYSKDYSGALRRLDFLSNNFQELSMENRYHLFKNRGWAYLELGNHRQAGDDLEWALKQRGGAAAHYLWGRVFEEQKEKDQAKAKEQWNLFIKAIQDNPEHDEVEPDWIAHAQEQLRRGAENESKTNP